MQMRKLFSPLLIFAIIVTGASAFFLVSFFLVSIINNCLVQVVTTNITNNKEVYEVVRNISTVTTGLVSFCNITLVICFYFRDKKLRDDEENFKNKIYWFRTVALERNFEKIEDFFNKNIEIVENCRIINKQSDQKISEYNQKFKQLFGSYTALKRLLSHGFTDVVRIINKSLGAEIDILFERFQDEFTNSLRDLSPDSNDDDYLKCEEMVYRHKNQLLEVIFKYETKVV